MYSKKYAFEIEGITPLLMHWDNIEWADLLAERRAAGSSKKDQGVAGDDRSPPETWKGKTYHDGTHVCVPGENFLKCMSIGGKSVMLGGKGKATWGKIVPVAVRMPPFLSFVPRIKIDAINEIEGAFKEHIAAVRKLGFDLFVKRARVGTSKHVRVRPRFDKWLVSGVFEVIDDRMTDTVVERILTTAGLYAGLCDWRPSSPTAPGSYGQFRVKDLKAQK